MDNSIMDIEDLRKLLRLWREDRDQQAATDAIRWLAPCLVLSSEMSLSLGPQLSEDLRQEALLKLLHTKLDLLLEADNPYAYAATLVRNLAVDALLKKNRTTKRELFVLDQETNERSPLHEIHTVIPSHDTNLDAATVLSHLDTIGLDGRLCLLLTYCPTRIAPQDWSQVQSRHPPPPPTCPEVPLDADDASRVLWPPKLPELAPDRRNRMGRFSKALNRAIEQLKTIFRSQP
jgi:hypothetical protein